MGTKVIVLIVIILAIVAVAQLLKMYDAIVAVRGKREEDIDLKTNNLNATLFIVFMIVFFGSFFWMLAAYGNGLNPEAASEHGVSLDYLFNITLFFTGIVFVITQILLFYFAWKYQGKKDRKALFMPHDNKLEIIWTIIPAVVMTFLVVGGLDVWNEAMADVEPGEEVIEFEATGYQFAWALRYPGEDGKLGTRDYTKINGINSLGQVWTDEKNLDDLMVDEIVLPKGKKVRVRIIARDVLHNFYLPHFRVKMDAVPGMPTYFIFTPTKTTVEYREELSKYPRWQVPADPEVPDEEMDEAQQQHAPTTIVAKHKMEDPENGAHTWPICQYV